MIDRIVGYDFVGNAIWLSDLNPYDDFIGTETKEGDIIFYNEM